MRPKYINTIGLVLMILYSLGSVCTITTIEGCVHQHPAANDSMSYQKLDSELAWVEMTEPINDSIEYDFFDPHKGWTTRKTIIKKGDCILIAEKKPGEGPFVEPTREEIAKIKEDSFYSEPLNDTILSRYSCNPHEVSKLWHYADSVHNGKMEVIIVRGDTVLCKKYLHYVSTDENNPVIPYKLFIDGLKRIQIHENRFKNIDSARVSFSKLAFGPNVVMRGDTSWLHGDNGKFLIAVSSDWHPRDTISRIAKIFPNDKYSILELEGRIWIDCDKSFYDKFNLYHKSEFQRPKKFSFVIYKKVE